MTNIKSQISNLKSVRGWAGYSFTPTSVGGICKHLPAADSSEVEIKGPSTEVDGISYFTVFKHDR